MTAYGAPELPDHMNGRIYDPLLGRFLSADIIVQSPTDLQSYNRYSYVSNNPLRYVDLNGFSRSDLADDRKAYLERQRKKLEEERKKNPPPPPDPFEGKENFREFYDYVQNSPGGQATIMTPEEKAPEHPQLLDANAPKAEHIEQITLQYTPGQTALTAAMATNLINLSGSSKPVLVTNEDVQRASTQVKQSVTEVNERIVRDGNGETRVVATKSPAVQQTTGQVRTGDAEVKATGSAVLGMVKVATQLQQGIDHAKTMSQVQVNLVFGGTFLGIVPVAPKGQIVVPSVSDMARVQSFAEHHGLPPIIITDRTVTIGTTK